MMSDQQLAEMRACAALGAIRDAQKSLEAIAAWEYAPWHKPVMQALGQIEWAMQEADQMWVQARAGEWEENN